MSGFFTKLFGGKKKDTSSTSASPDSAQGLVESTMEGLIERAGLDLSFEVSETSQDELLVELSGADEDLLTEKEGALLDAFQLFFKRVVQHQVPDSRVNVSFDCNGYRDESSKALVELAERLKEKALEQGRSVYLRALPPKDRKIVHQHLANDERVRSRSVGDGLFKKIKIYPVKSGGRDNREATEENDSEVTETV
ncbi:MAG: R3H domain-containing nucleic acid-binding protein [Bdellovibrionota bacterium]